MVGRGGALSSFWRISDNPHVFEKDVGMFWRDAVSGDGIDHDSKEISEEEDFGMILFDDNEDALSMHHACFTTTAGDGQMSYESYSVPLTRIIKAHQNFFPDVTVPESTGNLSIRQTSPQKRASRLVPQIDASFLAKHRPTYKTRGGVLRLTRLPGGGSIRQLMLELEGRGGERDEKKTGEETT